MLNTVTFNKFKRDKENCFFYSILEEFHAAYSIKPQNIF